MPASRGSVMTIPAITMVEVTFSSGAGVLASTVAIRTAA